MLEALREAARKCEGIFLSNERKRMWDKSTLGRDDSEERGAGGWVWVEREGVASCSDRLASAAAAAAAAGAGAMDDPSPTFFFMLVLMCVLLELNPLP